MDRSKEAVIDAVEVSFRERVSEARRVGQPAGLVPWSTDYPYRLVSIFLSMPLARMGVTPNSITIFWLLLGLAGACGLASPNYGVRVLSACLLEISYLLDFVDGEVARLSQRVSKRGLFLDLVGHGVVKTSLFLALGYQVFAVKDEPAYLLFAFAACVFVSNFHMVGFYAECAGLNGQAREGRATAALRKSTFAQAAIHLMMVLMESPGLYGAILVATIFDRAAQVLLFYGMVGPIWFLLRVVRRLGD